MEQTTNSSNNEPQNTPPPIPPVDTNRLEVTEAHRRHLKETSAIADDVIDVSGVRSFSPEESQRIFGKPSDGLAFPYLNLTGELIGYRMRLDEALRDENGKTIQKYTQVKGTSLTAYFIECSIPKLMNVECPLFITEGEKKLLSLLSTSLTAEGAVVSYPGCWNFKESGKEEFSEIWDQIPLLNRTVNWLPDTDFFHNPNVYAAGLKFLELLLQKGALVKIINLDLDDESDKIGVDDFLLQSGEVELGRRIANPIWKLGGVDLSNIKNLSEDEVKSILEKIVLSSELFRESTLKEIKKATGHSLTVLRPMMKAAIREWKEIGPKPKQIDNEILWDKEYEDIPHLYSRLCQVVSKKENLYIEGGTNNLIRLKDKGKTKEYILTGSEFSHYLAHEIKFKKGKFNKDGEFVSDSGYESVPVHLATPLLNRLSDYADLKTLKFHSLSPIFYKGKVMSRFGYDEDIEAFYFGKNIEPKSELTLLPDLLNTFPFADEISRVNALGAIIQVTFLLQEYAGEHPLILIEGDEQNLGKTTLARTINKIAFNQNISTLTYTPNDEELEERIATEVRKSSSVCIDNVKATGSLSSAVLERSLTDYELNFRLLGKNVAIRRINNVQFYITLNDGLLSRDLTVRALSIFLCGKQTENMPDDFNPVTFVEEYRNEILGELVGMIKKWEDAGSPKVKVNFPKYPQIAALINGILQVNGFHGFLSNYDEAIVKLDALTKGLLEVAYIELQQTNKNKTQEKLASQWKELLEAQVGSHILRDSSSDLGKNTKVGKALTKMVGKSYALPTPDQGLVHLKVLSKPNISKVGGNFFYWFVLEGSPGGGADPKSQKDQQVVKNVGTSAPKRAPKAKPLAKNKKSEKAITVEIQASWEAITPSRCFEYEFNGQFYSSKMWEGEGLGDTVALDFETTLIQGLKTPDLVLGSACNKNQLVFLTRENISEFMQAHPLTKFIVHNASLELSVLQKELENENLGFEIIDSGRIFDVFVLGRLLDLAIQGNCAFEKGKSKYSLGVLAEKHLNAKLPKEVKIDDRAVRTSYEEFQNNIDEAPDGYYHYNAFDTIATFHLMKKLTSLCHDLSLAKGADPELLLSHDIQVKASWAAQLTKSKGIAIDASAVSENQLALESEISDQQKILSEQYNYKSGKGHKKLFEQILTEIEKSDDVKFKRTKNKSGKWVYSERESDLAIHKSIPFVGAYLKLKTLNKALKTYVKPFVGLSKCNPDFDIIKSTGRTAIFNPPLQQVPRPNEEYDFRKQFVARPGYTFIISDLGGAELVTLAQTCLDRYGQSSLADVLNSNGDVHKITAANFLNKDESEVTKAERQYGKIANFGLPGGMGLKTLRGYAKSAFQVDWTEEEAEQIKEAWKQSYPEMQLYLNEPNKQLFKVLITDPYPGKRLSNEVQLRIYEGIIRGRRQTSTTNRAYSQKEIDWAWSNLQRVANKHPSLQSFEKDIFNQNGSDELLKAVRSTLTAIVPRSGRVRAGCSYTDFCNNAFQALTSDVAKMAWYELHKAGFPVVHFVHDEVVCEVPEGSEEQLQEQIKIIEDILISASKQFCPDVVMTVESQISKCWGK